MSMQHAVSMRVCICELQHILTQSPGIVASIVLLPYIAKVILKHQGQERIILYFPIMLSGQHWQYMIPE